MGQACVASSLTAGPPCQHWSLLVTLQVTTPKGNSSHTTENVKRELIRLKRTHVVNILFSIYVTKTTAEKT